MLRTLAFLLLSPLCLLLAACGGGGAAAEAATDGGSGTDAAAPPAPPGPAPADPALEATLRRLTGEARVTPLAPEPPEPPELVALGQALFFDRVLSGNRDISCYTCHDVDFATGDGLSVSIGTGGQGKGADRTLGQGLLIPRNAPPVFHLARNPVLFWDGRIERRPDGTLLTPEPALNGPAPSAAAVAAPLSSALAAQALFPVTARDEMRGQPGENELADAATNLEIWDLLMRRLVGTDGDPASGIAGYRALFAQAFPQIGTVSGYTFGHAARALAAFQSAAFDTGGAAFDRWLGGEAGALSDAEKRGGILFYGRADCARCHEGPALTDGRFHAIGVPQVGPGKDFPGEDTGRARVTGDARDRYRFRTPSLRNVALTGPWMHDGAYTTLENAVRHYVDPVRSLRTYDARQLSPVLQPLVDRDPARQQAREAAISNLVRGGVRLSPGEVADLVAFLRALTDADALDLSAAEPDAVPSGLPIDDE